MVNLGIVNALQGYEKDADAMLQQALTEQKKLLGDDHRETQRTYHILEALRPLQHGVQGPSSGRKKSVTSESIHTLETQTSSKNPRDLRKLSRSDTSFTDSLLNAMITAAAEGDVEKLQTIIGESNPSEIVCARGLREAAAQGQRQVASILLDRVILIDGVRGYYGTALLSASAAGDLAILRLLLQRNADFSVEGGVFGNILRAAIVNRHQSVVDLILAQGMGRKIKQAHMDSSIFTAIATRQPYVVQQLLSLGANVDAVDTLYGSPFNHAVLTHQEDIKRTLLDAGANAANLKSGLLANAF